MVWTVFRIGLRRLLHNRIELLLTFVVPIAFFSIFAVIFGKGMGGSQTPKIKAIVVDSVGSVQSRLAIERIKEIDSLRMYQTEANKSPIDEARARDLVRRGMVTIAVVVRGDGPDLSADLLSDSSDQVASQVVTALVTQALLPRPNVNYRPVLDSASGPQPTTAPEALQNSNSQTSMGAIVRVVDVLSGEKTNPVVSMYAAGIAVMFLLFGATGGGGSLLEEQESHTLQRLLTTRLTMDQLLLGKWMYQTVLGVVQVSTMFLWGWLVFEVDLWSNFDGFLLMTLVTSGAAASFGLLMATFARTRGQLNGISVILILTMSALGGSMVPRYLMSDRLREVGLYTFNAWALDGYDKVFWRELPIGDLWPQVCVLMLSGAAFLVLARVLAIRWETA